MEKKSEGPCIKHMKGNKICIGEDHSEYEYNALKKYFSFKKCPDCGWLVGTTRK